MENLELEINETVKEMQDKIDEINESAEELNGTPGAEKANAIRDKAVEIITKACEKLLEMAKTVKDSDELAKGIELVKSKTKDLTEATLEKLNEIKNNPEVLEALEAVSNKAKEIYGEVRENEKVKVGVKVANNIYDDVRGNVTEYMSRPDVQEKVDKAKDTTIDIAEKAVDALRNWLKPESSGENK